MAIEIMVSWHLYGERPHVLQVPMTWLQFLESGAWARPLNSSSWASIVTMHLVPQFLAYGIESKFPCKANKAFHRLTPIPLSLFIFCHLYFPLFQDLYFCTLWYMKISHVSVLFSLSYRIYSCWKLQSWIKQFLKSDVTVFLKFTRSHILMKCH